MTSFHTRNVMPQEEILAGRKRADRQEMVVLGIFLEYPGIGFTPPEVRARLKSLGKRWPLTSVRRAMTNLSKEIPPKLLKDAKNQRLGVFGVKNCTWKLAEMDGQMKINF